MKSFEAKRVRGADFSCESAPVALILEVARGVFALACGSMRFWCAFWMEFYWYF